MSTKRALIDYNTVGFNYNHNGEKGQGIVDICVAIISAIFAQLPSPDLNSTFRCAIYGLYQAQAN